METITKVNIFSLFLHESSISLYPTDEPFKLPVPFNNNFGALFVGILYLFVIVLHYNHH